MTATLSAATLTAQWRPQFMNQNEIMIKHHAFELVFFLAISKGKNLCHMIKFFLKHKKVKHNMSVIFFY